MKLTGAAVAVCLLALGAAGCGSLLPGTRVEVTGTEKASGPLMRLTVSGRCPESDQPYAGVANTGGDLTSQLLPSVAATGGLECQYSGFMNPGWHLMHVTRLDKEAARRVANAMAQLPISNPKQVMAGEIEGCPSDGGADVIALSFPGRPDVDLWDYMGECSVSNGFVVAGHGAG